MNILSFVKANTLPVSIFVGATCYLTFYYTPALDKAGDTLAPVFDTLFPFSVFLTLFTTFSKVNFKRLRPVRWHAALTVCQLLLIALNAGIVLLVAADPTQKTLWEACLTCVIAPCASAAPVVSAKLGGDLNTMTTHTLMSSMLCAITIPLVFPLLEQTVHVAFLTASWIILQKLMMVMLLPLLLGWIVRHYVHPVYRFIVSHPDLGFYCWSFSLAITTGITFKNIFRSAPPASMLIGIALLSLLACILQFFIGRTVGRYTGEHINTGQGMFQKNTAMSIWVAYMYLNPLASIGAGCYVLWQNIINIIELYKFRRVNP